jgi:alpha-tubulin suppressor-like RCC1 family protein
MRTLSALVSLGVLAACGSQQGIARVNRPPSVNIASHASGASVPLGYPVDLLALIADPDHATADLSALWFVDGSAMCGTASLSETGLVACTWVPTATGTSEIVVQGIDADGEVGEARLALTVVEVPAPSVAIVAPLAGQYYADVAVALHGVATHPIDAPDALVGWWTSDVQGTLVPEATGATDGGQAIFERSVPLQEGHHVLTLHSRNRTGREASASVEVDVRSNAAPTATGVTLNTLTPSRTGFLKATLVGYVDTDADPAGAHVYEWSRQSATDAAFRIIDGATTEELILEPYGRADQFRVRVFPADAGGSLGRPVESEVAVIQNGPPSLTGVRFEPSPLPSSSPVTAYGNGFSDPDGDGAGTFVYAWSVQRVGAPDFIPLPATIPWLTADYRRGERLRVHITPRDAADLAGAPVVGVIDVQNGAPSLTGVEIDPAAATVDSDLSVRLIGFDDPDGDEEGDHDYAWYVRPLGGTYPSTPDSTEPTLAYPAFGRADRVKVVITARDALAAAAAPMTSAEIVIGNAPPSADLAVVTPATPSSFDELSVSLTGWTDPDGDRPGTPLYAWYRKSSSSEDYDPTPIATTSTLPQSFTEVGDRIFVRVTPRDELLGEGAPIDAMEVEIVNTPPSIDGVRIAPETPDTQANLTASVEGYLDENGDSSGVHRYEWFRQRTPETGFTSLASTSATLSSAYTQRGDQLYVRVTPRDAAGALGAALDSAPVTIGNAPPSITSVMLNTVTPTRLIALTATPAGFADPDGDGPGSHPVAWYRAPAVGEFERIDGATSATLSLAAYAYGDRFRAEFTPVDADGAPGEPVSSPVATLRSTAPALTGVSLSPSPLPSSADLTATPTGYSDADGDIVGTYQYAWYIQRIGEGFTALPEVTGSVLPRTAVHYRHEERVRVEVTPSDIRGVAGPTVSAEITVQNGSPSATSVNIEPVAPMSSDTLTASLTGFADPDGDEEGDHDYAWYVQDFGTDEWELRGTDPTLEYPAFSRAARVKVEVVPHDPFDATGAPLTSAAITVGNTAPQWSGASITPDPATNAATLAVALTGWTDADGDAPGTHDYVWYRRRAGEVSYEATPASTLAFVSSTQTEVGDRFYVEVTPRDSAGLAGTKVTSTEITIVNTPPALASVIWAESNPSTVPNLTATATGYSDGDNDLRQAYKFEWYRKRLDDPDFLLIQTGTGVTPTTTLSTNQTVKHDQFYVRAAAQDVRGTWGAWVESPTITVRNTAPALTKVTIDPPFPMPGATVSAVTAGFTDTDGDAEGTHRFAWYVRPAGAASWGSVVATGPALPAGITALHDEIQVIAYPHDDDTRVSIEGGAVTSAPVSAATWGVPSVGDGHGCAIRSDGGLWCWGNNLSGNGDRSRLGDGTLTARWKPVPIGAELRWTKIAAGARYNCGITTNHELYCWGAGNTFLTALGQPSRPTRVGTGSDWVDVELVEQASSDINAVHAMGCAIRESAGSRLLYCWGNQSYGRLSDGVTTNTATVTSPQLVTVYEADAYILNASWSRVTIGESHACGVRSNGTLFCWGNNVSGRTGFGTNTGNTSYAMQVGTDSDWLTASAGWASTCGIRRASPGAAYGSLWCWGRAAEGQLGNGTTSPEATAPVRVGTDSDWADVTVSNKTACAVRTNGLASCWGSGTEGMLGTGSTTTVSSPTPMATTTAWAGLALGMNNACGTTPAGELWCWGTLLSNSGNLADREEDSDIPLESALPKSTVFSVPAIRGANYQVSPLTGGVGAWGTDGYASTGYNSTLRTVTASSAAPYVQISNGYAHTCGRSTEGRIWCWGNNTQGQLGNGNNTTSNATAVQVSGAYTDWVWVTAGSSDVSTEGHTCGIRNEASGRIAYCWGQGGLGRLGNNATTNRNVPALVSGGYTDWLRLAAGEEHTCGIRGSTSTGAGSLWCWGAGVGGALGRNSTTQANVPAQVVGDGSDIFTDWIDVSIGRNATCAVRATGALYCWGASNSGTNGNLAADRWNPTQIGDASDWESVSVGMSHACGIRRDALGDASIECWGGNDWGELGNGILPRTAVSEPTPALAPIADWVQVSAGRDYSCAAESDGTLWCWGHDSSGQLGLGYPAIRSIPARSL